MPYTFVLLQTSLLFIAYSVHFRYNVAKIVSFLVILALSILSLLLFLYSFASSDKSEKAALIYLIK